MLALLVLINLLNYMDRQVLSAVVGPIKASFFGPGAAGAGETLTAVMDWCQQRLGFKPEDALVGLLGTAFMVVYMFGAPVFARLAERTSRWMLIGIGVILWSLASGASGLAATFVALLLTRCLVGVGEAAYGPVAPVIISDLYPVQVRGQVLAWFYMAIPVGSALGLCSGRMGRQLRARRLGRPHARDQPRKLAMGLLPRGAAGHRARTVELLHARSAARAGGSQARAARGGSLARLSGSPAHALLRVVHAGHDGDDLFHRRHRVLDALLPGNASRRTRRIDPASSA